MAFVIFFWPLWHPTRTDHLAREYTTYGNLHLCDSLRQNTLPSLLAVVATTAAVVLLAAITNTMPLAVTDPAVVLMSLPPSPQSFPPLPLLVDSCLLSESNPLLPTLPPPSSSRHHRRIIFYVKKTAKRSVPGFSKNPATLFTMYLQVSTSDPSGVDMVPCRSVVILFNQEACIF